ncbi:MAG: hypothetical protein ACSLFK_06700 [Gemmatimonadaceae bacterium]
MQTGVPGFRLAPPDAGCDIVPGLVSCQGRECAESGSGKELAVIGTERFVVEGVR